MADDVRLSLGSEDGATIATDDDGSRHWQYLKVAFGADNTQTIVGSISSNPFPVALSDTDNAVLDTINTAVVATQAAVEGTLTVGAHAVTNAGTFLVQENGAALTALQLIDNAVSGAGFNITQLGGVNVTMDTGVRGTGVQRVTIATDDVVPVTNAGLTELALAINTNRVDVNIAASGATVTVSGTVTANAGTGDFLTIVGHTINEAFKESSAIGGQLDDAATTAATEGNVAPVRITAQRAIHVQMRGTGSNPLALNTGTRDADTMRVTICTDDIVPASQSGTWNIGTVTTVTTVSTVTAVTNLAQMGGAAISMDTGARDAGTQRVTIATNDVVPVNATLDAETTKVIGTVRIASAGVASGSFASGSIASGAVASGAFASGSIVAGAIVAGGSSFVHLEDVAHSGSDGGVPLLAVRDDVQGAITPADGDYTQVKSDMFGNLKTTNLPDATSEIKYAVVNAASGDNEIVALVSATKIRVLSVLLVATGTTTARFESNVGGTALTGAMPLIANSGFTLPFNPGGWFESASGQSISLECTAGIDGMISYVEV